MIKISKNNHELSVSKNAYEIMYKKLGYKEVKAGRKPVEQAQSQAFRANVKNEEK